MKAMPSALELFQFSRNPIDDLRRQDPKRFSWFDKNGFHFLKSLARDLKRHPNVRSCKLKVEHEVFKRKPGLRNYYLTELHFDFKNGYKFGPVGVGQSLGKRAALIMAAAECLERLGCEMYNYLLSKPKDAAALLFDTNFGAPLKECTSNGACFHSSPLKVMVGAICELLERDVFLANWYSHAPLPIKKITKSHPLSKSHGLFFQQGWELREHHWAHDKVEAHCVQLSLIRRNIQPNQWNFFLGGAASPRYTEAVHKALEEVSRLFNDWQYRYPDVDTTGRVAPKVLEDPTSRLVVFQRPDYARHFRDRCKIMSTPTPLFKELSDIDFIRKALVGLKTLRIHCLPVPATIFNKVYCIKAVSDELQDLDWQSPAKFNRDRIREIYGTKAGQFSKIPHPHF